MSQGTTIDNLPSNNIKDHDIKLVDDILNDLNNTDTSYQEEISPQKIHKQKPAPSVASSEQLTPEQIKMMQMQRQMAMQQQQQQLMQQQQLSQQ